MTYSGEVVIPAEISLCSAWVSRFFLAENEELMVKQLDSLEECQESTIIRLVEYQQKLACRFNRDIRSKEFSARDLVLRKVRDYMGSQCRKVGFKLGRSL